MSQQCPICGSEFEDGLAVCPSCGFRMIEATQGFKPVEFGLNEFSDLVSKPHAYFFRIVRGPQTGVELELKEGIIIAARHVHLYPETAEKYGVKDGDIVDITTEGERSLTLHNVLVRAGVKHADEVHIDTDEANACNLDSGVMVNIVTK